MARVRLAFVGISRIRLADPECFPYVLRGSGMNAIMTNFDIEAEKARETRKWDGLSEIDQAIRDNRLMEYRVKKAWADPWSRRLTVGVIVAIAVGFSYLVGTSYGLW